ncbi:MAG: hypothetical protein AAF449_20605 [Myxococcota bacterium]
MKAKILITLAAAAMLFEGTAAARPSRALPVAFLSFDALNVANNGDTLATEGFRGTRVFRIRTDGTTVVVADGLAGPIDVAEDDEGALYVTCFLDATVRKVAPNGTVTLFATVLPFPAGIVRDATGQFYVSHYGPADPNTGFGTGDTILKLSPEGAVSTLSSGGALAAPIGIDIGKDQKVYVANFHDGRVISISPNGQQHVVADLTGPEISFAIGHLAFAGDRLYATGIQDEALFRINVASGRFRARDISERVTFPNGLAFDSATQTLLVARGFTPNPDLVRIPVRSKH